MPQDPLVSPSDADQQRRIFEDQSQSISSNARLHTGQQGSFGNRKDNIEG